jgi:type IV pilus biogenesis protein CpaD/CtpE
MPKLQRVRSLHALCGLAAGTLLAACATVTATAAPSPQGSRTEKWIDLQVGDCVTDLPPADLSRVTVTVVDCATAHLAEVYLRAPMTVNTAITNVANRDCAAEFAPYTGRSVDGSPFSITYLIDSNQDRTGANPTPSTLICLLQAASGQPLTGSAHR